MMLAINSGYLSEPVAQAFMQVAMTLVAILAMIALIFTYPLATIAVIAIVVTVEMTTDMGIVEVLDDVGIITIYVNSSDTD